MERIRSLYDNHKKLVIITGIILVILLGIYLVGTLYFNTHFLKGTIVNNLDIGTLTLDEANDLLKKQVSSQELVLEFNDEQTETLQANQLGVSYNEKNSLAKLLNKQNQWSWINSLFNNNKNVLNDLIVIDDTNLLNNVKQMNHLQEDKQVAPTDAYLQLNDNKFIIIKETLGSKIELDTLINNIKVAISEGNKTLNLTKTNSYVKPNIYATDKDLKQKLTAANKYCLASIRYVTPNGKEIILDGNETVNWLTKNDDGTYTKDEQIFNSKTSNFVSKLASQYNQVGSTRTFTGKDGSNHTVSGGTYGFKVSQGEETAQLLTLINGNKKETNRVPAHTGLLASEANGGLGNDYLEINISKQHLWLVRNGSVVLESDLVSGKEVDGDRYTPSGTYYIYSKERNRVLRGSKKNGKYEYESPVSYWMPFNRGIGLHDASWRSTFGGDIYINSGSHGCINLPTSFAGQLYSQVYVNLPVVVYR